MKILSSLIIISLLLFPSVKLEAETKLHYNYRHCENPPLEVNKSLDKIYIQERTNRRHVNCIKDFQMEAEAENRRHFFNRMIMAAWGVGLVIVTAVVAVIVPSSAHEDSKK